MTTLKIKKLHPDATVPTFGSAGAACFDLYNLPVEAEAATVYPGETATFRTGLAFEIPTGFAMLIFSRSGHGFNHDVRLSNCVGVIDSDYRGEVKVKLRNDQDPISEHSTYMWVKPGARIAQAMLLPVPQVQFEVVDTLSETERGTGGFGSTGA